MSLGRNKLWPKSRAAVEYQNGRNTTQNVTPQHSFLKIEKLHH